MITSVFLINFIIKSSSANSALHGIINGFKDALHGSGFIVANRHQRAELFRLELLDEDDDETCDECLEKISSPPMDIADWMGEGFPKQPDPSSKCGGECRCELVRHKSQSHPYNPF